MVLVSLGQPWRPSPPMRRPVRNNSLYIKGLAPTAHSSGAGVQPGTGWQTPFPASLCPHQEPRDPLWQGCPRPSASCLHVGQGLGPTGASRAQPTGEGGDEQQSPAQTRVRPAPLPPECGPGRGGGCRRTQRAEPGLHGQPRRNLFTFPHTWPGTSVISGCDIYHD